MVSGSGLCWAGGSSLSTPALLSPRRLPTQEAQVPLPSHSSVICETGTRPALSTVRSLSPAPTPGRTQRCENTSTPPAGPRVTDGAESLAMFPTRGDRHCAVCGSGSASPAAAISQPRSLIS